MFVQLNAVALVPQICYPFATCYEVVRTTRVSNMSSLRKHTAYTMDTARSLWKMQLRFTTKLVERLHRNVSLIAGPFRQKKKRVIVQDDSGFQ